MSEIALCSRYEFVAHDWLTVLMWSRRTQLGAVSLWCQHKTISLIPMSILIRQFLLHNTSVKPLRLHRVRPSYPEIERNRNLTFIYKPCGTVPFHSKPVGQRIEAILMTEMLAVFFTF